MPWVQRVDLTGPPGADGSDADVTAHEGASDPHPQYTTAAELSTALSGYQPLDADLTTIAGLTATTDRILQAKSGAWTTRTPAQVKTDLVLVKADVGLGNVDNTADSAKPVSSAQQSALDLKAPLASPAFTGTPTGITKAHVGLGNVDNTADTAKPVSSAQQSALDLKANLTDTRLSVKPYPPVTVTYAATVSINAALGTHFRITATGNCQLLATTNATDGQVIVVQFLASGGARTLSLLTTATSQAFKFSTDAGGVQALTATPSGTTDLVQFMYDGGTARWWPIAYQKGF